MAFPRLDFGGYSVRLEPTTKPSRDASGRTVGTVAYRATWPAGDGMASAVVVVDWPKPANPCPACGEPLPAGDDDGSGTSEATRHVDACGRGRFRWDDEAGWVPVPSCSACGDDGSPCLACGEPGRKGA